MLNILHFLFGSVQYIDRSAFWSGSANDAGTNSFVRSGARFAMRAKSRQNDETPNST
jgi:hypothetical protein